MVVLPATQSGDRQAAFNIFHNVWREGQPVAASGPEGVCLVDEHGKLFTTSARPPESVKIEEQGPRKLVVRVEGTYAAADGQTYMRYIARLIFLRRLVAGHCGLDPRR